ncbi:MAG TPA: hypothetical protein VH302_00295 [Bryobacteraceae bacterium]|nr:hypothetical protein [Bryobacteraceae bacterium]
MKRGTLVHRSKPKLMMDDERLGATSRPENLAEMYLAWRDCTEPNIGWCLMCNERIPSIDDLIPGTSFHNCDAARKVFGVSEDDHGRAKGGAGGCHTSEAEINSIKTQEETR